MKAQKHGNFPILIPGKAFKLLILPLKAQPNPLEPFTDEARAATQDVVADMYAMFVDMVVEGRAMTRERVLVLADGRIFTGRQALANGLIDAIGAANPLITVGPIILAAIATALVQALLDWQWCRCFWLGL